MKTIKRTLQRLAYGSGLVEGILKVRAGFPIILTYHGVTANNSRGLQNYDGLHVPSEQFIRQLHFLVKYRKVISLTDMIEGIRRGDGLQNTVALTFDDGYENNFTQAAKILVDLKIPATFFLATGYIGANRWMWTDRLERMLERTERGTITLPGVPGAISLATLEERKTGLRRIKAFMKQLSGEDLESRVAELEHDHGLGYEAPHGDYRFMNWQQVGDIARAGFEVGAHTVNHPILSRISRADAFDEILASRDSIRAEIGKCSDVFCYPNGKSSDYTSDIVDFCRTHFQAALSTNRGAAREADLYELKRIGVSGKTSQPNFAWYLVREQ